MKRIYIAGAYSGPDVITVLQNIGKGEWYAAQIFKEGFAPFVPWHDKDFVFKLWDQELSVEQFYEYSMAWLEVSEAMFLVPGWEKSHGTEMEIYKAIEDDIPTFTEIDKLKEWRDGE